MCSSVVIPLRSYFFYRSDCSSFGSWVLWVCPRPSFYFKSISYFLATRCSELLLASSPTPSTPAISAETWLLFLEKGEESRPGSKAHPSLLGCRCFQVLSGAARVHLHVCPPEYDLG